MYISLFGFSSSRTGSTQLRRFGYPRPKSARHPGIDQSPGASRRADAQGSRREEQRSDVILDDAAAGSPFADPYLRRRQARSVLPAAGQPGGANRSSLSREQRGSARLRGGEDRRAEVARLAGSDLAREHGLVTRCRRTRRTIRRLIDANIVGIFLTPPEWRERDQHDLRRNCVQLQAKLGAGLAPVSGDRVQLRHLWAENGAVPDAIRRFTLPIGAEGSS